MKKIRQGVIVVALATLPVSGVFAADGDFSATVGLKMWNNSWSSWMTTDQYNGLTDQGHADVTTVVKNIESSDTQGWIPSFSVRYKDFMLGGSYFAKKSYNFVSGVNRRTVDTTNNTTVTDLASVVRVVDVKREEFDLIGGYYVLPTLAVIAGYKEIDQWFEGKYKYSGPIFGASASAPLTGGFSLYGTAAFGPMKLKAPNGLKSDADYRLGEVGLAYAFDTGGRAGVKSVIGTMGYRAQAIVTKLSSDFAGSGLKARDTTEGFTVGIVAAF